MLHLAIAKTPRPHPEKESRFLTVAPDTRRVSFLTEADRKEVMGFLSIRPVHTVVMTSFIHDNGIESELNRGRFFGYRNEADELEGVALIGHSTLFEARSDAAVEALAFVARTSETPIHLIMSAGNAADRFWTYFSNGATSPRLRCEEVLFQTGFPFLVQKCEMNIEPASALYLNEIAEAQAELAFAECGVDPLVRDREGFLKRVLRRIEQGRVFTVIEGGKLVFKADIMAETPEVIYLEGVYVAPEHRGTGLGSRCMAALSLELLNRAEHICLLSNVEFESAHRSFLRAGFKASDKSVTLFV